MLNNKTLYILFFLISLGVSSVSANKCEQFQVKQSEVDLSTIENKSIDYTWKDFSGRKAIKVINTEPGQLDLSLTFKDSLKPSSFVKKMSFIIFDSECNQLKLVKKTNEEDYVIDEANSTVTYKYLADIEANQSFYIKLFSKNKSILRGKRKNNSATLNINFTKSTTTTTTEDTTITGTNTGSGNVIEETHRDVIVELNDNERLKFFDLIDINNNEYLSFEESFSLMFEFRKAFGKAQADEGYNRIFDFDSDGLVGFKDFAFFRKHYLLYEQFLSSNENLLIRKATTGDNNNFRLYKYINANFPAIIGTNDLDFDLDGSGIVDQDEANLIESYKELFKKYYKSNDRDVILALNDSDKLKFFDAIDTDKNNSINFAEAFSSFANFRKAFGKTASDPGFNSVFDFDSDGSIGLKDFSFFRKHYGLHEQFLSEDEKALMNKVASGNANSQRIIVKYLNTDFSTIIGTNDDDFDLDKSGIVDQDEVDLIQSNLYLFR